MRLKTITDFLESKSWYFFPSISIVQLLQTSINKTFFKIFGLPKSDQVSASYWQKCSGIVTKIPKLGEILAVSLTGFPDYNAEESKT